MNLINVIKKRLNDFAAIVSRPNSVYIYDESHSGSEPTPENAKKILDDLDNGRALPHPISDPGWRERLEAIANRLKVP